MADRPLISPRMSLWLDVIRAGAAVTVLVGHGVQQGLYTGPWPFTVSFQQNAVVVFFVLSGLLIAASVDGKPVSLIDYTLARALRILPVALPALAIALLVAAWGQSRGISVGEPGTPADLPLWNDTLPALLFLSDSHRLGLWYNPPWWSLCFEVWFYALFGAAHFLRGHARLGAVALLALIAGANILLLLPVWWMGVWIARRPALWRMTQGQAWLRIWLAIAALGVQPLIAPPMHYALIRIAPWALGHALYAPSYAVLAWALALGLTGVSHLAESSRFDPAILARPIRRAADLSFSLYLLHWPLLGVLRIMGLTAGRNVLAYVALLAGIVAVSAAYASVTEPCRHRLRARIAAWRTRPASMEPAASP
jgi:peptidoglycan/LPS O-acetylase OafA/YrhL